MRCLNYSTIVIPYHDILLADIDRLTRRRDQAPVYVPSFSKVFDILNAFVPKDATLRDSKMDHCSELLREGLMTLGIPLSNLAQSIKNDRVETFSLAGLLLDILTNSYLLILFDSQDLELGSDNVHANYPYHSQLISYQ